MRRWRWQGTTARSCDSSHGGGAAKVGPCAVKSTWEGVGGAPPGSPWLQHSCGSRRAAEHQGSRGDAEGAEVLWEGQGEGEGGGGGGVLWFAGAAETARRSQDPVMVLSVPGESGFAGWSMPRLAGSVAG